jgi:hypothetical protein
MFRYCSNNLEGEKNCLLLRLFGCDEKGKIVVGDRLGEQS